MPDKNTTPKCDHIPILEGDKVQKKKEKEKKKVSEKPDRSSGSKNRRSSDNFLRVLKRARKLRLRRPLRNPRR